MPNTHGSPSPPASVADLKPIDIRHFIEQGQSLSRVDPVANFPRLAQEAAPDAQATLNRQMLTWHVQGEVKPLPGTPIKHWLHLHTEGHLPMICQRCLQPVDVPLTLTRQVAFAQDEATAAAFDEELDDDVLALEPQFDLKHWVEDECLMALPLVPTHETCPDALPTEVRDADFDGALQDKPNPFAALAKLRLGTAPDKGE